MLAELMIAAALLGGTIAWGEVDPDVGRVQGAVLHITKDTPQPQTLPLVVVDAPEVQGDRYRARTRIRFEGVEGDAYLEMWSQFRSAQGTVERYFTRTLAPQGPMASFSGTGDWRAVELPFDASSREGLTLQRIEFNLFLPGAGTVDLEPFTLESEGGAWWGPGTGGAVGGILGSLLGLVLALAGVLAARGRARSFIVASAWGAFALGGACLLAGGVALAQSQPYGVWYPLILLGVLAVVIGPVARKLLLRRYQEVELRRMRAMDA